ncbi:hypothetical protein DAPPUDRAFT_237773 [Daphnia pulex]|uniref:DUF4806 domain-containing protein n=1 Tax=Daphnia pulex TaxID=6669 RepID=E9G4C2_DAPPU|nr:hypothetical protein DAPPUDRAFT_237773 [Daphnia pulex]|eukprot:EFX85266.1 hypothetical protein DAPPUDRAFT_237773 [Daphnia pulex]
MSVQVYEDNGRFALINAQMPDHNGVFVTYTLVVPDFWLMAVDNKNGNKETYCAYKNCKDINVAVKGREVPRTDWPTYVAVVRKIFENFNSARQQLALAVEQTDLSTEEAAEEGRGKRPKRPPASPELGSAPVGVGEDSQLDSQLINSPTLSDSSDNEPIPNPGPVSRRLLPAVAKRPPFPSTTNRPATTGVVSRPSTSANTNQRFSSGVSTTPSSANNRQQFVIPDVNRRPPLLARPTTSDGIEDEALGENRPVLLAIEERPVRHARINGIENIDPIRIYKGILKLTIEVNELKDLITVLTKICLSKADCHTEGSETLDEIPICSVESFKAFEIKLKDSADKYSSLVKFIKFLGGNSEGDAVQRSWEKLTTIDCRAQCNFNGVRRGLNQKHPLKGSVITAALFAGIRANSQFANCTDATLEHETIRCFVRAPEAVRRRNLAAAAVPVEADDAERRPQQQ